MPEHSTISGTSNATMMIIGRRRDVIFLKFVRWSNEWTLWFLRCMWHASHFNECWPESVEIVSSCVFQARRRHSNTSGKLFTLILLSSHLKFLAMMPMTLQQHTTIFNLSRFERKNTTKVRKDSMVNGRRKKVERGMLCQRMEHENTKVLRS